MADYVVVGAKKRSRDEKIEFDVEWGSGVAVRCGISLDTLRVAAGLVYDEMDLPEHATHIIPQGYLALLDKTEDKELRLAVMIVAYCQSALFGEGQALEKLGMLNAKGQVVSNVPQIDMGVFGKKPTRGGFQA